MTDPGLPAYLTRQFALSQAQLSSRLGADLLALCQAVTADGRLTPDEIAGLKQWLAEAEAADLPAAKYLRASIERVLADGRITPDELREVQRAVEAVLPFDARQQALAARQHCEAAGSVGTAAAPTGIAAGSGEQGGLQSKRVLAFVPFGALAVGLLVALYLALK